MSAAPRGRGRRWLRRLLRWGLILALLLVALRFAAVAAAPAILDRLAAHHGLALEVAELRLALHRGELLLEGVTLGRRDAPGAAPYLRLEHARVELQLRPLLAGRLVLHRADVDGLFASIERRADGRLAFLEHFAPGAPGPPGPSRPPPHAAPRPLDFRLPFEIEAARVAGLRVRYVDASVVPPVDVELAATLRASQVGSPEAEASLELLASSPQCLDVLRLSLEGTFAEADLSARSALRVAGLRPEPLRGLLAAIGVDARADQFDLELAARLRAKALEASAARVSLELEGLRLAAGSTAEAVELDELSARATLGPHGLDATQVAARGLRAAAAITASGGLELAGLRFVDGVVPQAEPTPPGAEPGPTEPALWSFALERAQLDEARLTLADRRFEPPVDLGAVIDTCELADLVLDAQRPGRPARFAARVRAPGIVREASLEGSLVLGGPTRRLEATLRAAGIAPLALERHYAAAGLKSSLRDASLSLKVAVERRTDEHGRPCADVELSELALADGTPILEVDRAALEGLVWDRAASFLRIESATLAGTRARALVDANGDVDLFGTHTRSGGKAGPAASRGAHAFDALATLADALPSSAALLPAHDARFELGALAWRGARLTVVDQGLARSHTLSIDDAGVEASDVGFGGGRADTARFKGWMRSAGLCENLVLEGTLRSEDQPLRLELRAALTASGLETRLLEPYLRSDAFAPALADGRLRVELRGSVERTAEGACLDAELSGLALDSGGETVASLERLRVQGVEMGASEVCVDAVEIERPFARLARDAAGGLHLPGLYLAPAPPPREAGAAPAGAGSAPPAGVATAGAAGAAGAAGQPGAQPGAQLGLRIARLALREGAADWNDALAGVAARIDAAAELSDLALAGGSVAARASVSVADGAERLTLECGVQLSPEELGVEGTVAARGLGRGCGRAYLPSNVGLDLADGRLDLGFALRLSPCDPGGSALAGELDLRDLALQDAPSSAPRLALASASIEVERADATARELLVEELSIAGLELAATRLAGGALATCGLTFREEPARGAADAAATEPDAPAPFDMRPPRVRLAHVDLGISRLELADESRPAAAPLVLATRVRSAEPLVISDPDPGARTPWQLSIEGAAEPLVERFEVQLVAEPFALSPRVEATLAIDGIRGAALPGLAPELAASVDASPIDGGSLRAQLEATVHAGLGRVREAGSFGLRLELTDLELRDRPRGEVVLGLDVLHVDAPRIAPGRRELFVRSVSLVEPAGRITLRDGETELFGVLLPRPATASPRPAAASPRPAAASTGPPASAASLLRDDTEQRGGAVAQGEVQLSELVVTGIALEIVDETTSPPITIPLVDLYVEVHGASSRATSESRPMRVELLASAGATTLPAAEGETPAQVALFEEVSLTGWLDLFPAPHGWWRSSVSGLELAPLRERAREAGIRLKGGVLDSSASFRLDEKELRVKARSTFTNLSVSEPENGMIRRALGLPVPLNTAILVLEDADGELVVPLTFSVPASGLRPGAFFTAAGATLARMITAALAKSPLRITDELTSLVGLRGKHGRTPPRVETLAFEPGAADLAPDVAALRDRLAHELARGGGRSVVLEHDFGAADLERVRALARPSREESLQLFARIQNRRRELGNSTGELARRARTLHAVGRLEAASEVERELRATLRELDRVELALDQVGALLRPDAERYLAQRELRMGNDLAGMRLDGIRQALVERLSPEQAELVLVRHPTPRRAPREGGGAVRVTIREQR